MYSLPGSPIQFGATLPKKKPGRKSAKAQYLEQQKDLFPVDLYTSKLTANTAARQNGAGRVAAQGAAGARAAARSAAFPPATNRGGKVNKTELLRKLESMGYTEKDLEESSPYLAWMRAQ